MALRLGNMVTQRSYDYYVISSHGSLSYKELQEL
jgi:hypothetical protein